MASWSARGLVALIQVMLLLVTRDAGTPAGSIATRSPADVRRSLGFGAAAYVAIAALIALLGGLAAHLSMGMLLLFVIYAAFAALSTI